MSTDDSKDDDLTRAGAIADENEEQETPSAPEAAGQEKKSPAQRDIEEGAPAGADRESNFIDKGERVNLLEKDPVLREVKIGVGWDQRAFEEDPVDLDISVFMLNSEDKTREDEDFVFYNNPIAYDGGVMHKGDSRTGAGEGDDENITIHLHSIPYDIHTVMLVLSVYDETGEGFRFDLVKNIFVRIVNDENGHEIARYEVAEKDCNGNNALKLAALVREGPEWFFDAVGEGSLGGLGKLASHYGIIVKEVQSTGHKSDKGDKSADKSAK